MQQGTHIRGKLQRPKLAENDRLIEILRSPANGEDDDPKAGPVPGLELDRRRDRVLAIGAGHVLDGVSGNLKCKYSAL